jgi:drug/metabolite transporter (DMT)-like permease
MSWLMADEHARFRGRFGLRIRLRIGRRGDHFMRQLATDYRLGSLYSLATAALLATQEPFSFLAARHLTTMQFVCLTQFSLLISLPLLLARGQSRRDFVALMSDRRNVLRMVGIFFIGLSGLLLYNFGLSDAHPIIISAILNLSPFWAAMVARLISRKPIPFSPAFFFGCLVGGFIGAMIIPWSQLMMSGASTFAETARDVFRGGWIYAVPVPIFSALGGTLIGQWFSKYDESAAIAANFVFSCATLLPVTAAILYLRNELPSGEMTAIALMIGGTIIAASFGRVLYQISLSVTDNDNGFVTMFFLLVPALTSLISLALSRWIPDLRFTASALFLLGLALNGGSLLVFSLRSWLKG